MVIKYNVGIDIKLKKKTLPNLLMYVIDIIILNNKNASIIQILK